MSSSQDIVLAFDLYGTLLSTESIAKKLSEHFGPDKAQSIATIWRTYQLEYTWRLNSMSESRKLPHQLHICNIDIPQISIFHFPR
jgi:2-haloacid dehalogenase